jgi:hypothetical protein
VQQWPKRQASLTYLFSLLQISGTPSDHKSSVFVSV